MNPIVCLKFWIQRGSNIGWMMENGAATIGTTGKTCCRIICRKFV